MILEGNDKWPIHHLCRYFLENVCQQKEDVRYHQSTLVLDHNTETWPRNWHAALLEDNLLHIQLIPAFCTIITFQEFLCSQQTWRKSTHKEPTVKVSQFHFHKTQSHIMGRQGGWAEDWIADPRQDITPHHHSPHWLGPWSNPKESAWLHPLKPHSNTYLIISNFS